MYSNIKKASLPVNKPYFQHDLHLGEEAVANSDIFRKMSLRMYAGVPVADLTDMDGMSPQAPRGDARIDYLICRETDVIMAIDVTDRSPWYGPKFRVNNLLFVETNVLAMEQGLADNIIEKLEELLLADFQPSWQCWMYEFSTELMDQLIDARLMELQGTTVLPTEYGMYEGLVTIIAPDGRRSTQHSMRVYENLLQMFCSEEDLQNARFIHELAGRPLETHLETYPAILSKLQTLLPSSCRTCGQAAELCYRMLQDSRESTREHGTVLMQSLALPLYDWARSQDDAEDDAYAFPSQMAVMKRTDPFRWQAMNITVTGFFNGVGLCTGLGYPDWLAGILTAHYDMTAHCTTYLEALSFAYEKMSSAALDQDEGTRLMCQILIEPFHLIYQRGRLLERFRPD